MRYELCWALVCSISFCGVDPAAAADCEAEPAGSMWLTPETPVAHETGPYRHVDRSGAWHMDDAGSQESKRIPVGFMKMAPSEMLLDHALNQQVRARQTTLAAGLQPSAKAKLSMAVRSVLVFVAKSPLEVDVSGPAGREVKHRFSGLSGPQAELLRFYVLAEVSRILLAPQELNRRLEALGGMSEMTSMRLQMMMDRRSKFTSTLSNILKKIAATHDGVVSNLK